jgi:hypothetical protein
MWSSESVRKIMLGHHAQGSTALQLMALVAGCALAAPVHGAQSIAFDKPSREQRVALPADPDNPQAKAELRCFSYPFVMIKQADRGEVGAELAIVPRTPEKPEAACEIKPAEGQLGVPDALQGVGEPGYLKGKLGDYLIFSAAEGWQGAEGFWVYSQDGNKLFADLGMPESLKLALLPAGNATPSGQALTLRYQRVYQAQCSLFADAQGCWQDISQRTGLSGKAPDCRPAYQRLLAELPAGKKQAGKATPSLIGYQVEVIIDRTSVSHMTPVSGATHCWTPE